MKIEMAFAKCFLIFALVAINLDEIYGHGMMLDPVSRSSAWRQGFKTPANYNDNEVFCGGIGIQYQKNKGKCGECGDDWSLPRPRPNDNGGIYGTGTIVQTYKPGQTVNVKVKLTANHFGTFKFALCPLNHPKELEAEECFEKYPLRLADGSSEYDLRTNSGRDFTIPVVLPKGLTCKNCVMRWTYRGGNNWGNCGDGTSGLGCGPQETFRNCADVAIVG